MNEVFPLITDSFRFFRNHFGDICKILLPFIIPLELLAVFLESDSTELKNSQLFLYMVLVLGIITYPIYQGALIIFVAASIVGQESEPKQLYRTSMRLWFHLLCVHTISMLLTAVGVLALVIPGIIVFCKLAFAELYCVLFHAGVKNSLTKSIGTTKGLELLIFKGVFLIGAMFVIPFMVVGFLIPEAALLGDLWTFLSSVIISFSYSIITIYIFSVFTLDPNRFS